MAYLPLSILLQLLLACFALSLPTNRNSKEALPAASRCSSNSSVNIIDPTKDFPGVSGIVPDEYIITLKDGATTKEIKKQVKGLPKCSNTTTNNVTYAIDTADYKLLFVTLDTHGYHAIKTSAAVSYISPGQSFARPVHHKSPSPSVPRSITPLISKAKDNSTRSNVTLVSTRQAADQTFVDAPWWMVRLAGQGGLTSKNANKPVPNRLPAREEIWKLTRRGNFAADGDGVVIYVLDTGIEQGHIVNLAQEHLMAPCYQNGASDITGHGTSVATVINGANNKPQFGVAPGALIVSAKLSLGQHEQLTLALSDVARFDIVLHLVMADWTERKVRTGAKHAIMNMSVSIPPDKNVISLIDHARKAGIYIVVATANEATPPKKGFRAWMPKNKEILRVQATNINEATIKTADKSTLNVHAPGVDIRTVVPLNSEYHTEELQNQNIYDNIWTYKSGTSYATGMVSGLLAIHLQNRPASSSYTKNIDSFIKAIPKNKGGGRVPMFQTTIARRTP